MKKAEKKLTLSWRIGLESWESDIEFGRLMDLLLSHRAVVDEVAMFETVTHHLYIPLADYARRMEIAARRLYAFREAGIPAAGINVLCSIGHLNEAWSYMPPLPFQAMVGHDGSVSKSCACPNTPEMRAYVRAKYELVAKAGPDFIWVDDDIRMHHHGVAWGCFCPTCLALFAKRAGKSFTREELVQAFDVPGQGGVRELWVEQNIASIESLLADIRDAIHKVNPKIVTGLMTAGAGWTTYSGQAFDRWFAALGATKGRPGGGFYTDATPLDMVDKALEMGRQRAVCPAALRDIQYELENFPYQRLKKSGAAVVDECSLALAHGLNGVAFNMLGQSSNSFEDSMAWINAIEPARPAWTKWVAHAAGLPTTGLWPAWSPRLMARRSVRKGESWLGWSPWHSIAPPKVLADIGLPLASDAQSCGTILCGRVADAFSDDELKAMFSRGVLMDSTALELLEGRGLGHLTGVRLARRLDNGMRERFTDDPLNGRAADQVRDARIEFWGDARGMADILEPIGGGVRVLTVIEDYFVRPQGPGMTAFENELGGRVVVMGYAPWMFLHGVGKRLQLQNAADWITRDAMPVRVDETVPLVSVARVAADRGRGAVMLLNGGLDVIPEATVHLRMQAGQVRVLAVGRRSSIMPTEPEATGCRITLRDIEPWGLRMLLVGGAC
ncbi:MAG: hypothetical protein WCS01_12030 [bacterium]